MSIGIFDSGVGGVGILREIRRLIPTADLIYLADHAYAPYGVRSLSDLRHRSLEVADWLGGQGCEVVTIACNTASAAALYELREAQPELAFVGMEPAVKPAVESSNTGKVGVVATTATFQGALFASVVDRFASQAHVMTAACPDWVQLVEEDVTTGPRALKAVGDCLEPMLAAGIDVLVLACTHFPELEAVIRKIVGPDVRLVDPAPAVARQAARIAKSRNLTEGGSTTRLVTTGDRRSLARAVRRHGIEAPVTLLTLP